MDTTAVVFSAPGQIALKALSLIQSTSDHVLVSVEQSGISTGTERLLWSGEMPHFPGMGYPLVPGYETIGRVSNASKNSGYAEGDLVFVPGANCYGDVRGLFGGASKHIAIAPERLIRLDDARADDGVLLALAATAHHAVALNRSPQLIIGHGVLGRLMARIVVAAGGRPVVWETQAVRAAGAINYTVVAPDDDPRTDYSAILDASGDSAILDSAIKRLATGGEVTLAGFYKAPVQFNFAPAFMREAVIRVAAQWQPHDMRAVLELVQDGLLSLDGLITHRMSAGDAVLAYETAFQDPTCLKMVLDWRTLS
jgi:bacteriochlorophyllide a dehydrogenase